MDRKVRIAYIEDHRIVREGVNYLLSQYPALEIVNGELDNGRVDDFIQTNKPDVIILDLQLYTSREKGGMNGFQLCSVVSAAYPNIKLIAHTVYDSVESVNKFFINGGLGFVSKKSGHTELVEAIREVSHNRRYICGEIVRKSKNALAFVHMREDHLKAQHEMFTKTERSILEKIARGFSTKQIAQQLEVSEKTVETHRKHLFNKADVKNVAELIAFAYANRLLIE